MFINKKSNKDSLPKQRAKGYAILNWWAFIYFGKTMRYLFKIRVIFTNGGLEQWCAGALSRAGCPSHCGPQTAQNEI